MKKSLIISVGLFFAFTLFTLTKGYTQVGIGTTDPNQASLLDLNSPDKGLLIPRVALISTTDALPLSAHVQGMLVYNTVFTPASATSVSPGFYYNDGTNWIKAGDASAGDQTDDAWINNAVEDYVHLNTLSDGTTVRPEGAEMVVTDNGKVGIGTNTPTESIHVVANDADLDMFSHSTNDLTVFHMHSAGGTMLSPAAVSTRNTSNIFSLESKAYDGSEYIKVASITMSIDGSPSITGRMDMPGKISFFTTTDGTSTLKERMVIKNNGTVGIGTTIPSSKVSLDVNGMIKAKAYTVATLPTGTEVVRGAMAYVTDAANPIYLQPVGAGGNVVCPVFYNGINWVAH